MPSPLSTTEPFTGSEKLAIVRAELAAVTAPKIEVRAPATGWLSQNGQLVDGRITKDARLATLTDPDLEAKLSLARSRSSYTDRLLEIIGRDTRGDRGRVLAALNLGHDVVFPPAAARAGASKDAATRVGELRARSALERAAVAALEMRAAANALVSPCDCAVSWAVGDLGHADADEPASEDAAKDEAPTADAAE